MSVIHRANAAALAAGMTAAAGPAMAPAAGATAHSQPSFIGHFHKLKTIGSTVPRNGDVNPYGTVLIRHNRGRLRRGDVLICNFNNKANLQGTGTTIVEVSPGNGRTRSACCTRGWARGPGHHPGPRPRAAVLQCCSTAAPNATRRQYFLRQSKESARSPHRLLWRGPSTKPLCAGGWPAAA